MDTMERKTSRINVVFLSAIASSFLVVIGPSPLQAQADRNAETKAQASRGFRAGTATSNITPPLGEGIVGNFSIPIATHIHDELHARCLVLDNGKNRLAFAICDNVGIAREVF